MTRTRAAMILSLIAIATLLTALAGCAPAQSAAWPASESGNSTFYYFGSPD